MRLHWVLVVAAVCVGLVIGAVLSPALIGDAQAATAGVGVGRYQIYYSPRVERATYLLDTQTGASWQVQESLSGELLWQKIKMVPGK
jgi:hypothetical protein